MPPRRTPAATPRYLPLRVIPARHRPRPNQTLSRGVAHGLRRVERSEVEENPVVDQQTIATCLPDRYRGDGHDLVVEPSVGHLCLGDGGASDMPFVEDAMGQASYS